MAIDFPAAPVAGQIFYGSNGVVYQYSSTYTAWVMIASSVQQDASFMANGSGAVWAPSVINTWETANPGSNIIGNQGGYYNAATGVFTPPAGRYFLWGQLSFNSTTSNMLGQLRFRKNGVAIASNGDQNTAGTSLFGTVHCFQMVDANGTDTFELQVQGNVLMSNAAGQWGAFAVNQAGQIPGTGSAWRQIASAVPTAAPTIDLQNIPVDINHLQFNFDVTPSTNTHDFGMQFYDGSGTLITSIYAFANTVGSHTQANTAAGVMGSAGAGISNAIYFDFPLVNRVVGNVSGIRGRGEISNIRDATRLKTATYQSNYVSDDASSLMSLSGSGYRTTALAITGLRFFWNPSVNFTAGGLITIWGSP